MNGLHEKNGSLYAGKHKVLRGWESYNGWYWFATEFVRHQDSVMQDGKVIEGDTIWFGFVQGFEEVWGSFSQGEIESLGPYRVWEIPEENLPFSGRRQPRHAD